MATLSKVCKPDKFNLALPIFESFVLILLVENLFLNQVHLIFVPYVKSNWKNQSIIAIPMSEITFFQFERIPFLICMIMTVHGKEASFCTECIPKKPWGFLFMFWISFTSFEIPFLLHLLITILLFVQSRWHYLI